MIPGGLNGGSWTRAVAFWMCVWTSLLPTWIWPLQCSGRMHLRDSCHCLAHFDISHHCWEFNGHLCFSLCSTLTPLYDQLFHSNNGICWSFVGVSCLVPTLSLLHYSTGIHESLTCQVFGYIISVLKSVSMACLACISVGSLSCHHQASVLQSTGHPMSPENLHYFNLDLLLSNFLAFLFWLGETWLPRWHFWMVCHLWLTPSAYFTGFIVCLLYAPAA